MGARRLAPFAQAITMTKVIHILPYHSPCGTILLGALGSRLCMADWPVEPHHSQVCRRLQKTLRAEFQHTPSDILLRAAGQLDEFFARRRRVFDMPLLLAGTDFQKSVWARLLEIPYGTTVSYTELARLIGRPEAVRAVARAVGANSLSVFVPCHRVIGAGGAMTGYAGGLDAKRALLQIEHTK